MKYLGASSNVKTNIVWGCLFYEKWKNSCKIIY